MKTPLLLSALLLWGCSSHASFDSDRWKSADLSSRDRVAMVDGLVAQHPLRGMTRAQIVALLGEPTPTDKWDDWDMIYVLGPTDYMPIDNEWLVIKLDQSGHVSAFDVTED